MITVAVTGGIGSGKSTVCRVFRAHRIPVLSADDLAKDISWRVPVVRKKILRLLGRHAYRPDGTLDRKYVAEKVFGRPRILKRLEAVLHPAVLRRVRSWLLLQRQRGRNVAVIEAALVFESGLDALVDLVVVIDAPKSHRVRRIQTRENLTKAHIRRRMDAQMPDKERRNRADVLIRNAGSKAALLRKARFLIQVLRRISH